VNLEKYASFEVPIGLQKTVVIQPLPSPWRGAEKGLFRRKRLLTHLGFLNVPMSKMNFSAT